MEKIEKVCQELERLEKLQKQLDASRRHTGKCACCCGTKTTLRRVETAMSSTSFLPYLENEAKDYIKKYSNVNKGIGIAMLYLESYR